MLKIIGSRSVSLDSNIRGRMSEPHVQLIAAPNIEIHEFLRIASTALQYNLMKPVDQVSRKPNQYESFLIALACFHDRSQLDRPIKQILPDLAYLRSHLFFTF